MDEIATPNGPERSAPGIAGDVASDKNCCCRGICWDRIMKSTGIYLLALGLALLTFRANASTLYAIKVGGPDGQGIWTVDQSTGKTTELSAAKDFGIVYDLASDWRPASFRIWAREYVPNNFYRIDAAGNRTLIGQPTSANFPVELAFDVTTDTLYGTNANQLSIIDPDTLALTPVALISNPTTVRAKCFDLAGTLFGTFDDRIVKIDKTDGSFTVIGRTGVGPMTDLAVRRKMA